MTWVKNIGDKDAEKGSSPGKNSPLVRFIPRCETTR